MRLLKNTELVKLLKDAQFLQSFPELSSVKLRKSGCGGCGAVANLNTLNAARRVLIKLARNNDPRLQLIFRVLGLSEPVKIVGYEGGQKMEAVINPAG